MNNKFIIQWLLKVALLFVLLSLIVIIGKELQSMIDPETKIFSFILNYA